MVRSDDNPDETPASSARSELSGSAGDVVQARDVHGGVHFHGAGRSTGPLPRQLPADVRGFVNRIAELAHLDEVLSDSVGEPLAVGLSVIAGTAGVGKTSLALHWAHRARERFPDGQLYVNLRGYDPGPQVTAGQALDGFLSALGVPPPAIPADLDARAALYRSLLAERRILVILDNAATVGQVRPLLPGTARCLVVVTSRNRLSGLVVRDGAHRLTLDVLTEHEAILLLEAVIGGQRTEDDLERLVELARLCARLPLALRIAAERAARRPWVPLAELIADLRDESGLWDALSSGDEDGAEAVRTVFAWSYRALPEEAAHTFRLLGLHPGPEFSTAAAAVLIDADAGHTRQLLDVLVGAHLLGQNVPDRYHFHDLLRHYATNQANHEESTEDRDAILRRVLTWYLHTANAAAAVINPFEPRVPLDPPGAGVMPLAFVDSTEAMRWWETERVNLVAATRAAADADLDRIAWQLAVILRGIYMQFNPFDDWFTTARIGLDAARRLRDRGGEAEVLESLAIACTQSHRVQDGIEHYQAVLLVRRELGDRFGEALALNGLGILHFDRHELNDAHSSFEQSLLIFRGLDNHYWEAVLTATLAELYVELERFPEATGLVHQALDVARDQGDRLREGNALYVLSMIHRGLDQLDQALESVRQALIVARDHDNRVLEAHWSVELGRVQQAAGQHAEALVSYQRAAVLQRQMGDRSREAQTLHATGEAYRELGRADEAANFHRHAVTTYRELGDRWRLALSLTGLAADLDRTATAAETTQHRREALALAAEFDDPRAVDLQRQLTALLESG